MQAKAQVSDSRMTPLVSQQGQVARRFRTAMRSHQIDLRLGINHIENHRRMYREEY
jgi:hypothetical protein